MTAPDVSICIPTYNAEPFIERTLKCAAEQTYSNIEILISVDVSDDRTLEICNAYAATDSRIRVFAHENRLGWAKNTNFLYEQVRTPYYCTYFHDDEIEPDYIETLRDKLEAHPDAVCAYSDMQRYGDFEKIDRAADFTGTPFQRLAKFLIDDTRGTIIRGLIRRSEEAPILTYPTDGEPGRWQMPPFKLALVARGNCLAVSRPLYRKWQRSDGLVGSWHAKSVASLAEGTHTCVDSCMEVIREIPANTREKQLLRFCLYVFILNRMRTIENTFSPAWHFPSRQLGFEEMEAAPWHLIRHLPAHQQTKLLRSYARLLNIEGSLHLNRRRYGEALASLSLASTAAPDFTAPRLNLARTFIALGIMETARLHIGSLPQEDNDVKALKERCEKLTGSTSA